MTESTKIDYVSIVQDLRDEADLCRNETATDIADLLDDAASCIVAMKSQFTALRSELAAAQEARQRAEALAKEAIAIAILLFDAWEDGTPCFETDGESGMGASIGNAFKLSDDDFTRCVEFLNRVDPRGTAIDAARDGK